MPKPKFSIMLPPKKWGGRIGRYREYKMGVRRSVDPFALAHPQIRSPLEEEYWTIQRFRTEVESVSIYTPHVHAVVVGTRTIRAQPSLMVTLKDGTKELHLVLRYPENERRIPGCRALARHLRAKLVVLPLDDIRRDKQLLRDIDYLQRCATRQLDDLLRPDEAVLAFVEARREMTVGEIRGAHCAFDKEAIDAAIAVGHLGGNLTIKFIKEQPYGDRTIICAA